MSTVEASSDLSPSTVTSLRGLLQDREASWREVTGGTLAVGAVFLAAATTAFAVRVLRRRQPPGSLSARRSRVRHA